MKLRASTKNKGFTLLEVVLAMTILAILASSIVHTMQSTLNLSSSLIEKQERSLHTEELEEHLERHLLDITSASDISLTIDEHNQNMQTIHAFAVEPL